MKVLFSDQFVKSLNKHKGIKKIIQRKVDMITDHSIELGEPLKGSFRGYYSCPDSCPVKRNFLIVFLYCYVCRRKGDDKVVLCNDCNETYDDTIKFIDLGPHNEVYGL